MSDAYTHDMLIHQRSGRLNLKLIRQKGIERACREFGGNNPPPRYVRHGEQFYRDIAVVLQRRWRMDHGLPIHDVPATVPSWGNSGDSYR